jgi:hypothetical protein
MSSLSGDNCVDVLLGMKKQKHKQARKTTGFCCKRKALDRAMTMNFHFAGSVKCDVLRYTPCKGKLHPSCMKCNKLFCDRHWAMEAEARFCSGCVAGRDEGYGHRQSSRLMARASIAERYL